MSGIGIAAVGTKLLGIGSAAKSVAASIPPKVWYGIAIAAALVAAYLIHHHVAGNALKKADAAGYARAKAEDAKAAAKIAADALTLKQRTDALTAQISATLKERNDEEHARNASDADAMRLRGPGAAACPSNSGPAAAPDRHVQAAPASHAAVAPVPPAGGQQLIALPFDDTVTFGQAYDDLLADDKAMRAWGDQILKVWPKSAPPRSPAAH